MDEPMKEAPISFDAYGAFELEDPELLSCVAGFGPVNPQCAGGSNAQCVNVSCPEEPGANGVCAGPPPVNPPPVNPPPVNPPDVNLRCLFPDVGCLDRPC
jgi:hypothetical protein